MKSSKYKWGCFVALIVLGIITEQASAAIVNINSRTNNVSNPVEIVLNAGIYNVEVIGTAEGGSFDAWNAWGRTTCANINGCAQTIPTTVVGWLNAFEIASPDLTAVSVNGTVLDPVNTEPAYFYQNVFLVTPTDTRYRVSDGLVYPTALSALANAQYSQFTLSASSTVGFAVIDRSSLVDNVGGISLRISEVPVPSALILFGSSLMALFAVISRRKFA